MVPKFGLGETEDASPTRQHGAANGKARPRRDQGQKTGPEDFAIRLHRLSLQELCRQILVGPNLNYRPTDAVAMSAMTHRCVVRRASRHCCKELHSRK